MKNKLEAKTDRFDLITDVEAPMKDGIHIFQNPKLFLNPSWNPAFMKEKSIGVARRLKIFGGVAILVAVASMWFAAQSI